MSPGKFFTLALPFGAGCFVSSACWCIGQGNTAAATGLFVVAILLIMGAFACASSVWGE